MFVIKIYGAKNLLVVMGVIFVFSLTLIFWAFSKIDGLSIGQKIEYGTQALTTTATILIAINSCYVTRLALAMNQTSSTTLVPRITAARKSIDIKYIAPTQEQFIPERFSQAIEQLGNEKIETRLGAIYALERIAHQDFSLDHWTIMEILAAFIRENAPVQEAFTSGKLSLPTDIQAALTVIGRRNSKKDLQNQKIDLRYTNISRADLTSANLESADFTGANLQWVILYGANLQSADLTSTNLQSAILYEANLQSAILYEANLQSANFTKANLCGSILNKADLQEAILNEADLQGAILNEADLQGAILYEANLKGTIFEGSNLKKANLIGANLQEANLVGANLQGALLATADMHSCILYEANLPKANLYEANLSRAILIGANLQEANLQEANLCGADLTRAENLETQQLESAIGDRTTRLPDNVEVPKHWMQIG